MYNEFTFINKSHFWTISLNYLMDVVDQRLRLNCSFRHQLINAKHQHQQQEHHSHSQTGTGSLNKAAIEWKAGEEKKGGLLYIFLKHNTTQQTNKQQNITENTYFVLGKTYT